MKKAVVKTIIFVFVGILLSGLLRLGLYLVDMQYSQIAPSQLNNDEAYGVFKLKDTIISCFDFAYVTGLIVLVILILVVWKKALRKSK